VENTAALLLLLAGFVGGYGVRELVSRRRRAAANRRYRARKAAAERRLLEVSLGLTDGCASPYVMMVPLRTRGSPRING
jgi:hypothetical protein